MSADPVMAVLRVRVPADVDPGVVEAELTRAFWKRSVTAELALLPSLEPAARVGEGGLRQHGFVAVLRAARPRGERKLTGVAEKAARKRLRRAFGPESNARVRLVRSGGETAAGWRSMRGTPHRI
ncbi:hypothetical protein [Pseudonocardia humida]|uniref:Uncharacterized protein n=1 Tax=Pseudonocardia humida TaxID=2800819 RepID=A0ABT0ZXV1_9PSEU|nr:hypothetical protein [Pseudonocardia humida]MCO1655575.1 hypothetical protein [Pseudonocardia humida]